MSTQNSVNNLPGLLIPLGSTSFEATTRFSLSGISSPTFDTSGSNYSLNNLTTGTSLLDWPIIPQNANATNIWTKLPWFAFGFQETLGNLPTALMKMRVRIQANGDSTTSDTVRHMGLLVDTTGGSLAVKLTVADGTTQATTTVTSSFTSTLRTIKQAMIVYVSSSLVELWVDGSYVGNVTSNIPTNASANVGDILHFGFRNLASNATTSTWKIPSVQWGYLTRIYH